MISKVIIFTYNEYTFSNKTRVAVCKVCCSKITDKDSTTSNFIRHLKLHKDRPDSQKAGISPDAGMLRKLVRDRNCHPVLRGILESLLRYLTQDLPKWTTRNRNPERPGLDNIVERNTDLPDQRNKTSVKKTQLQTSCITAQLPEEHKTTQKKTAETSPEIPEKCWWDSQKKKLPNSYGGDQKAGDLIPRRLTTFQLLQSKFIRSTPKPPITHQREVGALSPSGQVAGDVNHCQDSEHSMHKKDRTKGERRLKRGGNVKDIVAKFALAEQKEKRDKMLEKQPIKPRLIRRGMVLSSLMEKFESMAIVCKGSDLKWSHERPFGGVSVTSNLKQRLACHEKWQPQVVDQTEHTQSQHKQMKSKSDGKQLKGNQRTNGQEHETEQAVDVLTKVNLGGKNHLKAEQMRQNEKEHTYQKSDDLCVLKHIKVQVYGNDVEGQRSEESGETQTTLEEKRITNKLKYGHPELLCLTSVTESSLPEPYRLFPQVEAQENCHVATIMTCSPVWSTCADSSPKQYSLEPTESSHTNLKTEAPEHSYRESSLGQPAPAVTEAKCLLKSETEGLSTYTGQDFMENRAAEDLSPAKAVAIQRTLPMYVIPCFYRFDVNDQTNSSPQSVLQPETVFPSVSAPPTHSDTSMAAFSTELVTCPSDNMKEQTLHTITKEKLQENEVTPGNIKDTSMLQTFGLSEYNTAAFEHNVTAAVMSQRTEQKPKYKTSNYGDPSVKLVYKPKIIRFTDTFTF